ncbi:MAG: hypothetical protein R3B47_07965 [Bacteroidia bacterium]
MHQKRVIVLLRSFSEDELQAFASFIHSPYFNTNLSAFPICGTLLRCMRPRLKRPNWA